MTKDKDVLKDICSRIPYGIICMNRITKFKGRVEAVYNKSDTVVLYDEINDCLDDCYTSLCIPYLFPLSSMTEKQREEYNSTCIRKDTNDANSKLIPTLATFDFCNKYHLDHRGLIDRMSAIDATGLNIY